MSASSAVERPAGHARSTGPAHDIRIDPHRPAPDPFSAPCPGAHTEPMQEHEQPRPHDPLAPLLVAPMHPASCDLDTMSVRRAAADDADDHAAVRDAKGKGVATTQAPSDAGPSNRKGKGVSRPLPIAAPACADDPDELFSMSPVDAGFFVESGGDQEDPDPGAAPMRSTSPLSDTFDFLALHTVHPRTHHDGRGISSSSSPRSPILSLDAEDDPDEVRGMPGTSFPHNGKGRETPPTLPALSFTPMEIGYGRIDWPSPASPSLAGPSSFGSAEATSMPPTPTPGGSTVITFPREPPPSPGPSTPSPRMLSRARSMSNLSTRSTRSLSSSMHKIKVRLSAAPKGPSNLAKKLFRRRDGRDTPSDDPADADPATTPDSERAASPAEDATGLPRATSPVFDLEAGPSVLLAPAPARVPAPRPARTSRDAHFLKGKTRSYSSPFPLASAVLDVVPPSSADLFVPVVLPPPPPVPASTFEARLPRELKIRILADLVRLHEAEHARRVHEKRWTVQRASASRNRWVGRDRGVRELVSLSRVSHAWQDLALDGQLWRALDLRAFPQIPAAALARIAARAGPFVRTLDAAGQVHLTPDALRGLAVHLSLPRAPGTLTAAAGAAHTQLTDVNLRGCTAATMSALHTLLERAPALERLCMKGLRAVGNSTFDVLAEHCRCLRVLDVGRCPNIDAEGVRALARAALKRNERLQLTELRASGLKHITDSCMAALGRAAPFLEVLDLSYARGLHNSAVRAFVACADAETLLDGYGAQGPDGEVETVLLTSRQAGFDPGDPTRYRRRVTRLRHICFSSCVLLTDVVCKNLAHAVPRLEFLELAGIGAALRDDGLVHLLRTTPLIRRLDLEDASALTDAVLDALTPPAQPPFAPRRAGPPTAGERLEHLALSYAGEVTDDALMELARRCARLRVLEVDNTRCAGAVVQEFVKLARRRGAKDARIVANDCRNVGESSVKEISGATRPRAGWRAWDARKLAFLDALDGEGLEDVGQDECDPKRIVLKTFYSWQTVDAVRAARKKRAKAAGRRERSWEESDEQQVRDVGGSRARWWSPGGRRGMGALTPTLLDTNEGRDGCTIM